MSLCTRNRWGTGNCSNGTRSETNKEMEDKLKKMREERNKQDTMWTQPTTTIESSSSNPYVSTVLTSKVVDNK
jgi:hypothetical protein